MAIVIDSPIDIPPPSQQAFIPPPPFLKWGDEVAKSTIF